MKIEIVGSCQDENAHKDLDVLVKKYICQEQGEKCALSPFRDDVADAEIENDGYFLRHDATDPQKINVYLRKTSINKGYLWNSYTVNITWERQFGLANDPINTTTTVKPATTLERTNINTPTTQSPQSSFIKDLQDRLKIQSDTGNPILKPVKNIKPRSAEPEIDLDTISPRTRLQLALEKLKSA